MKDRKQDRQLKQLLEEMPEDGFFSELEREEEKEIPEEEQKEIQSEIQKETLTDSDDESSFLRQFIQQSLPALALVWMELVFHIYISHGKPDISILYLILFAAMFGWSLAAITGFMPRKAACIVNWTVLSAATVWFMTQAVYQGIFDNFLSFSVMGNADDAKQFWREALLGVWKRLPLLLLLLVPTVVFAVLMKKGRATRRFPAGRALMPLIGSAGALLLAFLMLGTRSAKQTGRQEIFFREWQTDRGIQENGVVLGLTQDLIRYLTYDASDVGQVVIDVQPLPFTPPAATPTPTVDATPEPTKAPEITATPTPTPVDRSPHTLPIDFAFLAEETDNKSIKTIHEYMASTQPVNKNEYTGMFEGYNLIMLTCETFSPLALDEELTPTLYRLVHEGFYFENFYTPYWITSTSDGEYVACTGLLPDLQKSNSFSRSSKNAMPCTLGHIFHAMGYTTYAFHDHDATYYDRDKSHPNMGYTFIARGTGLEITDQFPESDVEMMEQTIPLYVNEPHFHAYYMTMSGHMGYEWSVNAMGRKHRDEVQGLPYGELGKCYIACTIELDNAISYLIEQLDEAGVLDNTLIVLSGDHYPYGLGQDARNEIAGHEIDWEFELFQNHLVIWNPSIEHKVISKAACSLDIQPTVLNLLGIEYDSRLYMGTDIFSESLGLVQFKDNSFLTDFVRYNAPANYAEWLPGTENWDKDTKKQYLETYKTIVRNKFNISRAILNNNYFATIQDSLWWMNPELN